nr:hypothetical protein [Paracidovorax valerianellae]
MVAGARDVSITPEVAQFIAAIVAGTRKHPSIRFGASPRGTLGLARMARALSCIRGLSYVDPAVVREAAVPVLAHRIIVQTQGAQPKPAAELIQDILLSQRTPV